MPGFRDFPAFFPGTTFSWGISDFFKIGLIKDKLDESKVFVDKRKKRGACLPGFHCVILDVSIVILDVVIW
jgi:hypothetical protein